jgi:predicted restriction endonuclease
VSASATPTSACCSLHHRALDHGAISLSDELTILVSTSIHGGAKFDERHRKEVFRPPPRDR